MTKIDPIDVLVLRALILQGQRGSTPGSLVNLNLGIRAEVLGSLKRLIARGQAEITNDAKGRKLFRSVGA